MLRYIFSIVLFEQNVRTKVTISGSWFPSHMCAPDFITFSATSYRSSPYFPYQNTAAAAYPRLRHKISESWFASHMCAPDFIILSVTIDGSWPYFPSQNTAAATDPRLRHKTSESWFAPNLCAPDFIIFTGAFMPHTSHREEHSQPYEDAWDDVVTPDFPFERMASAAICWREVKTNRSWFASHLWAPDFTKLTAAFTPSDMKVEHGRSITSGASRLRSIVWIFQ